MRLMSPIARLSRISSAKNLRMGVTRHTFPYTFSNANMWNKYLIGSHYESRPFDGVGRVSVKFRASLQGFPHPAGIV